MIEMDLRPKHQVRVPGLGVFIAPNAVVRLFQLHSYTRCPDFTRTHNPTRTLYPVLRPNVYNSPQYRQVSRQNRRIRDV